MTVTNEIEVSLKDVIGSYSYELFMDRKNRLLPWNDISNDVFEFVPAIETVYTLTNLRCL